MHQQRDTEHKGMASHLHLSMLQSPSHNTTRASPWKTDTKAVLVHSTTSLSLPLSKRVTTSLCAQDRGFGRSTVSNKKQRPGGNNSNKGGEDEEDAIPEVVFNRMLARIVSFVGAPMASGIILLYALNSLKEQGTWESPRWLPFLTILLAFGTSALGIAYGTLSTSWDPEKEGSLLGWEEAQKNWPELWREEEDGKR